MKIRIQLHDQLMWEPIDQETQQWDKRQKLQPVNGAISIPYRIIFPELFEKKKKKWQKFLTLFIFLSLRAVCGCWGLKHWLFLQGFPPVWKDWRLHLFMYSIKILPLPGVYRLSPTRFQCPEGPSKSSFEEFLSRLLCYHIGELKSFTFEVFVCFLYPLLFFLAD